MRKINKLSLSGSVCASVDGGRRGGVGVRIQLCKCYSGGSGSGGYKEMSSVSAYQ